jgi:hypothetical protein
MASEGRKCNRKKESLLPFPKPEKRFALAEKDDGAQSYYSSDFYW